MDGFFCPSVFLEVFGADCDCTPLGLLRLSTKKEGKVLPKTAVDYRQWLCQRGRTCQKRRRC
jgi:hypothetical protein